MRLLNCVLFSLVTSFSCGAGGQVVDFVEDLGKAVDEGEMYNVIVGDAGSLTGRELAIAKDLWNGDVEKYPEISLEMVSSNMVRVALAGVLLQGARHCLIGVDAYELHDFLLAMTKSADRAIEGRATLLLGLAGYESDIPYLSSIVLQEEPGFAEDAVLSLSFISSDLVLHEMMGLREEVHRQALRDLLDKKIDELSRYRLRDYSEGCK